MNLPYRQIHLDFHTSPYIEGIGAEFDPEAFADTLVQAHITSVTCFARCHHGLLYYRSEAHPERIHPHLVRPNLLQDQIAACHTRGIRVPIYTTVQWDDFSAKAHQEWMCTTPEGGLLGNPPFTPGFYRFLDILHPGYRQFLKDHVAELFRLMPVDGLFFDIVVALPSVAPHWLDAMDNADLNPEDPLARMQFAQQVIDEWKNEMSAFVRKQTGYHQDCTIFYNGGGLTPTHRSTAASYTHFEIESLPGGSWGYQHFPVAQRYGRGLGKTTIGMTGKFHTTWGDFGSYKNPAALEYECFHALALGAGCSIGDQLPPSGMLDQYTYKLIDGVYQQVAALEPWCINAQPVADIGVFTTEEFALGSPHPWEPHLPDSILGVTRMLQELHAQFDILSSERELSPYKLLILPDDIPVDPTFAARLEAYINAGGAIIASHRSGLRPDGQAFALDSFGVSYQGDAPFSPDFLVPGQALRNAVDTLHPTGYVMYQRGLAVAPHPGSEVLAEIEAPYFNRTWRHYCSHQHTPSSQQRDGVAAVRYGRVIYFSHPIFTTYRTHTPLWCRDMLAAALRLLLPTPIMTIEGPSTLVASLMQQPAAKRFVLHLLHYIPERRSSTIDVIEDIIPLYNLEITLCIEDLIKRVASTPDGEEIPFTSEAGQVSFTLPQLHGYTVLELVLDEYEGESD